MKRFTIGMLVAVLAVAGAAPAVASGFSIYEQGAKASAQAGAWVARADDAAANWYNPAAMTRLDGMQIQFGLNLITIGSDTHFTLDDSFYQGLALGTGNSVNLGDRFDTESSIATPFHLYFTQKISDKLAWGVGINTPIGLETEWSDAPIVFSSRKAELATFVVNPNVAFRLDDHWSLAVGLDYMYADVKEFSQDLPTDLDGNPANGFELVGRANLTGDGNDLGWNVAVHYADDAWSFGFTYRSELSPDIDGTLDFSGFEVLGPLAPPDSPGSTTLNLPAQAAVGFAWNPAEAWEVEFDVSWAEWSNFDALDIRVAQGNDIFLREDWDNTFAYRVGAAYALNDRHEVRFGALYDESPIPTDTLRPSIPDSDRWSVTVGYGFTGKKWNVDAYYMPLFFKDITAKGDPANAVPPVGPPNGVIDGTYESFVNLFGVTFNVRF